MGSSKPKPVQAPFQQQQQQTNTFGAQSIADTPEAQAYLSEPLDFGSDTNVDPGVARRTDLAEQRAGNQWDSSFNAGIPREYRQLLKDDELRQIRGQGAYEAQNAQYLNQQGNNARRERMSLANVARRERLLPQILQTGGSGNTSGFNTQFPQSQPGFLQRLALGAIGGVSGGLATRSY